MGNNNKATPPNLEVPKFWVTVTISGFFAVVSVFMILSNRYSDNQKQWAFGIVGIVIGYWLNMTQGTKR